MAKEDFLGDEILSHLGLGTEILLKIPKNSEMKVETKLNPDLDLSILT
jgi:hypothetical protein